MSPIADFLTHGPRVSDLFLALDRAALGSFFMSSGFHKFFSSARRAALKQTFIDDGLYSPAMMYVIPGGELLGGLALASGFLTIPAAIGLIVICLGACLTDGLKRIPAWKPIDGADWFADVLYLPEVLYIVMLSAVLFLGAGAFSLDAMVWGMVL